MPDGIGLHHFHATFYSRGRSLEWCGWAEDDLQARDMISDSDPYARNIRVSKYGPCIKEL